MLRLLTLLLATAQIAPGTASAAAIEGQIRVEPIDVGEQDCVEATDVAGENAPSQLAAEPENRIKGLSVRASTHAEENRGLSLRRHQANRGPPTMVASDSPLASRGGFNALQKIFQIRRGTGNFGIGKLTASQADELGRAFVGNGRAIMKGGKQAGIVSDDGLRVFRFPALKQRGQAAGQVQANIEEFFIDAAGKKHLIRNAHIDIVP